MFNQLKDAINWIETQVKFKPKTDLKRMAYAVSSLKLSFDDIKLIHVAGTNGKGSVCSYLTHILLEKGLSVGTYTSPYLISFNERISLNGKNINDDDLLDEINFIKDFNEKFLIEFGEHLAFFELITLSALHYYHKKQVDVIIMEVGLGGLLDATNVLNYDLSLITNIGFDHMKQLGNTLESISHNKLGILKPHNHLITTVDKEAYDIFYAYLKDKDITSKFILDSDYEILGYNPLRFKYQDELFELSLLGKHQVLNAILAIEAVKRLYPSLDTFHIQKGLKKAIWAGRLEEVMPNVYIDGAHNAHAFLALEKTITETFNHKKVYILFSALYDKDILQMLDIAKRFSYKIVLTSFDDPRFQDLDQYLDNDMIYIKDFNQAFDYVKNELDDQSVMLVTGSLHFAGYAKKMIKR
ncbi:MAG: folylpolyglutamate synthase/dihydrofolate synthase family protein [Acholeplasmataceae bacterium]